MLFSTEQTRAIVSAIWLAGDIAFGPGDPTADLDGILSDYGIAATW